ncbi:METRNL [Cordylochernes scorpioides]|uniref:METRNL n=1 Tax=Cordylochernes scorpioides TaxID=51811 RepID=A0ABY6K622_9ARAC|nr:METRNL [Cordylochernes scorpioides]
MLECEAVWHSSDPRGVTTVYLRCNRGAVTWRYPEGAVRVVLRAGGPDFKACFRVQEFRGVRVFLEGRRKLLPVVPAAGGERRARVDRLRCFESHRGQLALYIEAEPRPRTLFRPILDLQYDLQPLGSLQQAIDDIRGRVSQLYDDPDQDKTLLTVVSTKKSHDPNSLTSDKMSTLTRHLQCRTKRGTGEFIFMTREILGDLQVVCAPRLSEWKRIRRKAIQNGTHECRLE